MPTYQLGQVDFLAPENRIYPTVRGNERVYIKDVEGTKPAIILFEGQLNEVTVVNPRHISYDFVPVDNNITVVEQHMQNKVSICDAMILSENLEDVYFIELKNVRKQWLSKAISQLESTIEMFNGSHGDIAFKHRLAYACNRRHPFPASYREREEKFRNSLGFKLVVSGRIDVL